MTSNTSSATPLEFNRADYATEYDPEMIEVGAELYPALSTLYPEVKPNDMMLWLEGGDLEGDPTIVDRAVHRLLGKATAEYYDSAARLVNAVGYALNIEGYQKVVGGIDVSKRYKATQSK